MKNADDTSIDTILDQMAEPRPLPMGLKEFDEWAERIIAGALIPGVEDPVVFMESQKFALAGMLMHLGPTESHKPDAYFIHGLRKAAVNEVAYAYMTNIKAARAAKAAKETQSDGD